MFGRICQHCSCRCDSLHRPHRRWRETKHAPIYPSTLAICLFTSTFVYVNSTRNFCASRLTLMVKSVLVMKGKWNNLGYACAFSRTMLENAKATPTPQMPTGLSQCFVNKSIEFQTSTHTAQPGSVVEVLMSDGIRDMATRSDDGLHSEWSYH